MEIPTDFNSVKTGKYVTDKGVLLRIREIEGKATEIELSAEVRETDIFGDNGSAPCKKMKLNPYECKTVLLQNSAVL